MAQTVCVLIEAADRERLAAIVADRNRPRKQAERARIALARLIGVGAAVVQSIGVSRPTVAVATTLCRSGGRGCG
jgi:hypothetical protein